MSDDVAALAARHAELAADVAERTRELAATEALLAEAAAHANRPMLDDVRVASPCPASWDDMVGDDRVRHCAGCDKDVFNLSALTRDEAEALIRERVGNLCGRYYQRADGTIITSDCTVGISRRRKRRVTAAGFAALLAGAGGLAFALSRRNRPEPVAFSDAFPPTPLELVRIEPPPQEAPPGPDLPMMGAVAMTKPELAKFKLEATKAALEATKAKLRELKRGTR